ncbi:MAG TPA: hypothetical protein HA364_05520 [Thermoplasmata archaeon]|nr:hypothetical protein [Thermoplasmata archaeon]
MANLVKGMKNWLVYSTMDEGEWDTLRKVYLEEEVRRLFSLYAEDLETATQRSELGDVSVPVRSGAFRKLKRRSGKVFLSKDEYEDGEQIKVHLMVSASSPDGPAAWEPLCAWTFDSISEVADFVTPPSAEPAS